MRTVVAALALLATVSCADAPTGPTIRLNEQFTLSPGESAAVANTNLQLMFAGVASDSRCPADALCIQLGDAVVRLRAADYRATLTVADR